MTKLCSKQNNSLYTSTEQIQFRFFWTFFDIEEKKTGTVFLPICLIEIIQNFLFFQTFISKKKKRTVFVRSFWTFFGIEKKNRNCICSVEVHRFTYGWQKNKKFVRNRQSEKKILFFILLGYVLCLAYFFSNNQCSIEKKLYTFENKEAKGGILYYGKSENV